MSFGMDPYHSAAMLSLGGIKSFVFARQALVSLAALLCLVTQRSVTRHRTAARESRQALARREFSARLTVPKQRCLFPRNSTWPPSDKGLLFSARVKNFISRETYKSGRPSLNY